MTLVYFMQKCLPQDHLTGGHVIMLGSGNEEATFAALAAYPLGLQVGGGITQKTQKNISMRALHMLLSRRYIFMMVSSI